VSTDNKDFTDLWLLFLHSDRLEEFDQSWNDLVGNAQVYEEVFGSSDDEGKEDNYEEINFFNAIDEKYINKNVCYKALVTGEAIKPYRYPSVVRFTCNFTKGDKCKSCGLFLVGGKLEMNVTISPLELIDISDYNQELKMRNKAGVIQCGHVKIEALEEKNLQEIYLSPVIEEEKMEQRFTIRHAYCLGNDVIPNKIYKFYGKSVTEPKNQSVVFLFDKYEEEQSSLDTFELTREEIEGLKVFQLNELEKDETISEKLAEIYYDFSTNLSPSMRKRDDILFACDLIYHTVLEFRFLGSEQRGWGECLIVGDTSTGKTKTAQKLLKHYQIGIIQGAENSTVAGLIGGITRLESSNIMMWGLLPLNNSKLVVLDEMTGIDASVIGQLTEIRGEGIASRVIAGGPRRTSAKVRLIWLSNPRKRAMNLYDTGCDMVQEIVPNPEDISRFDFILTVSGEEVTAEQMNITYKSKPKHKYKTEASHKLALWAWSRKSKHIKFTKEVEDLILKYSIEMAEKYSPAFPLVLGSTIRLKLAKLSVSLAVRLFSTEDGIVVDVKEAHVHYIKNWLDKIYNKASFGYGDYSLFRKETNIEKSSAKNIIRKDIASYCTDPKSFLKNMLNTKRITALEIRDFSKANKLRSNELRENLVNKGFIENKGGYYIKTPTFRKFLKEELKK